MKKLFFTAFFIAVLSFTATAQDIKFGVKSSLSFNKIFCDNITTFTNESDKTFSRFGTQSGVYGAYALNEDFQVAAELLYGYQGFRTPGNYRYLAMTLNYVNVPIMAKYYVANNFAVEAGPQFSYCLNGHFVSYVAGQDTKIKLQADKYNKFDLGLVAGVSYDMEYLSVWARYGIGFINIFKEGNTENMTESQISEYHYYYPSSAKNSVISFGLAYRILR